MKMLLDTGTGRLLGKEDGNWRQAPDLPADMGAVDGDDRRRMARRQIASFLRRELPVRFAHRARELSLSRVPYGLGNMPAIQEVKRWYEQSFDEVMAIDPELLEAPGADGDEAFRNLLDGIYRRHQDTLVMVARGLYEFQKSDEGQATLAAQGQDLSEVQQIHDYFDRFFLSRIGIRILIGHFLELYEEQAPDYVGLICTNTSATKVARAAAEDARYMCERQYGQAPNVEFLGRIDLTFAYIPSHLYYVLFELLKNSMRATAEYHKHASSLPDVRVVIADGEENEDVVIRISDLGGGIPRSIQKKVFSYLFTTAREAFPEHLEDLEDFGKGNPLAGLGYGLPISRGYVRYFKGDLTLMSMEGYGTDAFIHMPRLSGTSFDSLV